jgi:predicted nucleic-acid-binding Zn-ribbon protein
MADESDLTQEQAEILIRWLDQKIPQGLICSACGKDDWNLAPTISTTMVLGGTSIMIGGTIQPLVTLTCKNCGHTVFFNALISGVMKAEKKESADASDK